MKLSEAILLGDGVLPQTWTAIFERDDYGAPCATCAIGGALQAMGKDDWGQSNTEECLKLWPWLNGAVKCPVCNETQNAFEIVCFHLGNPVCPDGQESKWDRSRIAAFVATIEPQETAHDLQPLADQELPGVHYEAYAQPGGVDK